MDDKYKENFEAALSNEFDNKLKEIENLTWLPWVGKFFNQNSQGRKILIVAESHYTNIEDSSIDKTIVFQEKQRISNDPFYTRKIVAEYPLMGPSYAGWKSPTFDNLFKLLISDDLKKKGDEERRIKLCSNLAYVNMIQRVMWYSKNRKERPNDEDRKKGWSVIIKILKILKPDMCIFAGAEASRNFKSIMNNLGIQYSDYQISAEKIVNTYPKSAKISLDGDSILFKFIRHPSSYFKWKEWKKFVFDDSAKIQEKFLLALK